MAQFVLTAQLQLQAPNNVAQVVNQIQSQLNGVSVNVQVQGTAQANRQVQQLSQNLNTANSAASNLGRTFALSFRRFAAFAVATRAVSLFTNTLSKAVEEAIDFERQLVKISQVTGKSLSDLRDLTNEITRLATGFGVSSKELINVTQILAQAGLSARETKVALDALAKSALAPNFDSMAETAEGAIAVLAQFKQGVGELESQLGSINAVAGAFAVEASDLIDVIRRTGGVFKASGGDLNELIALFTSVRATTRESAESIGTGLRTIFTRIQRPKTIEFLKQFGVELVDLEGKFVGPFEAVRRLSEALSGLGEGDITFIRIAEELGGFRQIGKVLPLLTEFRLAQEALNVAQKGGAGLTKDAATAQQALAIRIIKVKEEFLALVRSITETSSFQFFANTALNLASALIKLADSLKPIIPLLAAVAAIKIARGFGDFVGGFMGGMRSRRAFNSGGRVMRFARGGFVPGSGNRDTVPAMLQPGEFVIRKSSVKKLGAGNLAAMNENRYASGGLVIKQTLSDQYAGLFAKPQGNDSSGKPVSIPLATKGVEGQEVLAAIGSPKSYFIGGTDESTFERNAENKLISAISEISSNLGGPEVPSGALREQLISAIGVKDIAGKIFEGVSRTIAGSFGGTSTSTFDVPRGTVNNTAALYSIFNAGQPMPNIDYDAKLSENRSNRASLLKKAINSNLLGADIQLATFQRKLSTDELIKLPKGEDRNRSLLQRRQELLTANNNASKIIDDEDVQKIVQSRIQSQLKLASSALPASVSLSKTKRAALGGIIQKFAKGGKGLIQKGQQAGGIGIFDSDKIPGGTNVKKALLEQIKASKKPYQVISGPAGSGKTTFAAARFGGNFILSPADLVKYSRFVILSGAGKTKTGDFSDDVKSLLSGASSITLLAPDKERLMKQRQSRVESASAGNLQDERSVGALQGTLRAPTDTNEELFRKYPNVNVLKEYATGGGVGTDTVPALLTPGEFVVNRSSAQKIGYGNLNRMNKVGKYASGGVVQRFANGGMPTSSSVSQTLQGSLANFASGFNPISLQSLNKYIEFLTARIMGQIKGWDLTEEQANLLVKNVKTQIQSIVANNKALDLEKETRQQLIQKLHSFITTDIPLQTAGITAMQTAPSVAVNPDRDRIAASQQVVNAEKARAAAAQEAAQSDLKEAEASDKAANSDTKESVASGRAAGANSREPMSGSRGGPPPLARGGNTEASNQMDRTAKSAFNLEVAMYAAVGVLNTFMPTIDENSTAIDFFTKNIIETTNQLVLLASLANAFGVNFSSLGQQLTSLGQTFGVLSSTTQAVTASQRLEIAANNQAATSEAFEAATNRMSTAAEGAEALSSTISASADMAEAGGSVAATASDIAEAGGSVAAAVADVAETGGSIAATTADVVEAGGSTIATIADILEGGASAVLAAIQATAAAALAAPLAPLIALAVVITAVVAGIYLWNKAVAEAAKQQKEKAIEKGDVEKARKSAGEEYNANASNTAFLGTLATALIIGIGPGLIVGLTTLILGAIFPEFNEGINVLFGGKTKNSVVEMANAQALAAQSSKALAEANKNVTESMRQFEEGTINASDVIASASGGIEAATVQREQTKKAIAENEKNKAEANGVRSFWSWLPGIESVKQRNDKIDEENKAVRKESQEADKKAIEAASPGLQALQRQITATGGSFEDFLMAVKTISPKLATIIQETGTDDLEKSFNNLAKQAEITKKAFEAMNLGFQNIQAVSGALSVSMENFLNSQSAGYIPLENSIRLLEASVTSAAQGIGENDFANALDDAKAGLKELGASEDQIQKFEENLTAINTAQKYFAQISEETRNSLMQQFKRGANVPGGAEGRKEFFAKTINEELGKAGIGQEIRDRISAAIAGGELSEGDIQSILGGNLEVLDKVLKDLGDKTLQQVIGPLKELAKYEGQLVQITKQKLELENKVVEAQRNVLEAQLEAAEIIAKYGGKAVTPEDRRQNAIAQANLQTRGTGVSQLKTGSAAELNKRNQQIRSRLEEISKIRQDAAQGGGGLAGKQGAELEAEEKRLQELAKSDYETTKKLIQQKEEELKLIGEKNKLEKDSIDALISGDTEKFFQLQAAQGATAAIATGNVALQQAYGPSALGMAAQNIQRQQEAGVQTLYGQQLGGAGGLVERGFGAALGSRGIQDARMAQVAAGTTMEEEGAKAEIRSLAETLPNYAETQLQVSEQELVNANLQMQAAEMQLEAARANVEARSGEAGMQGAAGGQAMFRKGGIVYANRGIFVPRGTDTVPAMLTPGEFVVRREAVQRGNNLQILQAMNRSSSSASSSTGIAAMAQGGVVKYRQQGSTNPESGQEISNYSNLIQALGQFNSDFSNNIDKLSKTNFMVKLDPTNINVNFTGSSFLEKLTTDLKKEVVKEVISEMKNKYSVGDGGRLQDNPRVL